MIKAMTNKGMATVQVYPGYKGKLSIRFVLESGGVFGGWSLETILSHNYHKLLLDGGSDTYCDQMKSVISALKQEFNSVCQVCNGAADGDLTDNTGKIVFCSDACATNLEVIDMLIRRQDSELANLQGEIEEKQRLFDEIKHERLRLACYLDAIQSDQILRIEQYRKANKCSTVAAIAAIVKLDQQRS